MQDTWVNGREIFEYIRRRKHGMNYKVGVVLGKEIDGTIKIGWSKCNFKAGDKFDPSVALKIAEDRIKMNSIPPPDCIKSQVRQFASRAVRYFKDAQRLEMP